MGFPCTPCQNIGRASFNTQCIIERRCCQNKVGHAWKHAQNFSPQLGSGKLKKMEVDPRDSSCGGSGKTIQEKGSNERSRMNLELDALELHIGGWTEDVVMNNNSYYI